ncbi:MAG: ligand-binding SRPBCC domain-containing protein [Saprospiraceae bacterium]|jgi:ligand-binding SRPBCC domain-containing protein
MIIVKTKINAPISRCFDLSTSIDLHKISASKTKEEAIEGITEGLIKMGETVTWKAKHFGIWHRMKVKITNYEKPITFTDEMVSGTFKFMKHKHEFKQEGDYTIMIDYFDFQSPLGFVGKLVDMLFLEKYMTKFLLERNMIIKDFAETDKWKQVL